MEKNVSKYPSSLLNKEIPQIAGYNESLNVENLDLNRLNGKVILIQFWTFGCYNCINTLPYMKKWYSELYNEGIEFISIHTPEFDYEKKVDNVKSALLKYEIEYPVLLDNEYQIWKSFENRWWPHFFLIDKKGVIRYNFVGEGQYIKIRQLLIELNDED